MHMHMHIAMRHMADVQTADWRAVSIGAEMFGSNGKW